MRKILLSYSTVQSLDAFPLQEGIWCGIELDSCEGRHGGQYQGVQYFDCHQSRGLFAPLYKVALLSEDEEQEEQESSSETPKLKRENTFTIEDDNASSNSGADEATMEDKKAKARSLATLSRGAAGSEPRPKVARRRSSALTVANSKGDANFSTRKPPQKKESRLVVHLVYYLLIHTF